LPHDAYCMGCACCESICGNVAGYADSVAGYSVRVCVAVKMVVGRWLLPGIGNCSFAFCVAQVYKSRNCTGFWQVEWYDQNGDAFRHTVDGIFVTKQQMKRIILASKSPRRKMLLEWAEIPFEVRVKDTDEKYPEGASTEEVPIIIARGKANAIEKSAEDVVLAADTIVVIDEVIIGKPENAAHANRILKKLSGATHRVITGVVIMKGEQEIVFSDTTEVTFHKLTEEQINFYIEKYKPYDKAGAYAIQEWIGVTGIKKINGDFYNVMGLPVSRVVKILQEFV